MGFFGSRRVDLGLYGGERKGKKRGLEGLYVFSENGNQKWEFLEESW